ncbi:preprotein translocase subunit SecA [Gammaproteobacteria bacterium]|jgi:preprotein translocase subunit SecA|nr:preprotein translocase subunit SecA [Gammaproteobacteria bacterium]MDA8908258.1 preprotein translocase subunit SecA [Gammaproteobacteria bacterium]MDA8915827.1 preprotein translocase subunit SecA [Gammaproteobacteria bacterium]MDA9248173.1 preprotein translocase subunit SecA [Gammaproteobacteria bacterium]MDB3915641.1 preprotein translocase subunit SecA [Gammaproteobacteria bacterium]|tara:strand:+ start:1223 stop:3934 length:2712 start_codon:yes stop_codon:yes gene_type:complete
MLNIFSKIFGSNNDRVIKDMMRHVNVANGLEDELSKQPDSYFKTLKEKLSNDYDRKNPHNILPLAFAAVREASKRTLGLRHFDSQMLGGISLAEGNIAEMKTGEGKTLVATLPAFLNSAIGNKTILVTVNDYLARRDAEWMRPIYEFLGLSVGIVTSNQEIEEKIAAYKCDIIYATNNELGFDYLRDNMAHSTEQRVQCSLDYAIVDEVDSILIDEARTPLIISGPSSENSEMYKQIKKFIPKLNRQEREETDEEPLLDGERGHYLIDEKNRSVELTDDGYVLVEEFLEEAGILGASDGLYSVSNLKIMKFVQATLRASFLFKKNVDYLVRNGEVLLIDEHTGRTMPGRRMSEGVHQALECKENVAIQRESQTLASTTFQNFFRLFKKLSGMTGTADTEAVEFSQIYGLNVIIIPTNVPMARADLNDLVFLTTESKYKALIEEIEQLRKKSSPILVGTVSVESSEEVSAYLNNKKIPHQILNAKHHEKEAEIIANAGKPGMVTIATNMAGRGTDIVLGGKKEDQSDIEWKENNKKVIESGGLHILGTERHESRRIDNQLRGRSGRQGDPGYSKFFLSLEDDLLRLFISDGRRATFERLGMGDDHIEAKMLSRGIENAQKRIESRNFDARKNLLEYDDVSNDQRQAIYSLRNQLLEEEDISSTIESLIEQQFKGISNLYVPEESIESQWKSRQLDDYLKESYGLETDIANKINSNKKLVPNTIAEEIIGQAKNKYSKKFSDLGENRLLLEKQVMLQVLDVHWKEHLSEIDHLRNSVGLRAYAQKNPKNEFKREAYSMFESMLSEIDVETIRILFSLQISTESELESINKQNSSQELKLEKEEINSDIFQKEKQATPMVKTNTVTRNEPKLGRNDLVKITNGHDTQEMKYKKAKPMIESGEWRLS